MSAQVYGRRYACERDTSTESRAATAATDTVGKHNVAHVRARVYVSVGRGGGGTRMGKREPRSSRAQKKLRMRGARCPYYGAGSRYVAWRGEVGVFSVYGLWSVVCGIFGLWFVCGMLTLASCCSNNLVRRFDRDLDLDVPAKAPGNELVAMGTLLGTDAEPMALCCCCGWWWCGFMMPAHLAPAPRQSCEASGTPRPLR